MSSAWLVPISSMGLIKGANVWRFNQLFNKFCSQHRTQEGGGVSYYDIWTSKHQKMVYRTISIKKRRKLHKTSNENESPISHPLLNYLTVPNIWILTQNKKITVRMINQKIEKLQDSVKDTVKNFVPQTMSHLNIILLCSCLKWYLVTAVLLANDTGNESELS